MVLRKYSSSIDLRGTLSFIFNRLRDGDALVVVLLRETLFRMGGLGATDDLSLTQLESLGGSQVRIEAEGEGARGQQDEAVKTTARSTSWEREVHVVCWLMCPSWLLCIFYRLWGTVGLDTTGECDAWFIVHGRN